MIGVCPLTHPKARVPLLHLRLHLRWVRESVQYLVSLLTFASALSVHPDYHYFSEYFTYLSEGNATTNTSLPLARNCGIWLAHLRTRSYSGGNLVEWAEIKSYYIIKRETLAH